MQPDTERRIRIRFEYTRYPHWGAHSGYTQFTTILNPKRYEVERYGTAGTDPIPQLLQPVAPLLLRSIRRAGMSWYQPSDFCAELRALRACVAGRVDVVHFLDGEHSGLILPRLLRFLRLPVRTIATFHQPPEIMREIINEDMLQWLDHIVLVSPSQVPYFSKKVCEEKINVFLHGIDTSFFSPRSNTDQGRIRCITVGHWLRDWTMFREVATKLSEVEFIVVTRETSVVPTLPNVRVHTAVDDESLVGYYRASDILFLPLLQSTANNALLEGIACGLPAVVTALEALRAYLPNGEAMLVADQQADAYIAAIETLRRDPRLRREIGSLARKRAEELAWARIVHEYESLYDRAVGWQDC